MAFVHLHVHSEFSLLDGAASLPKLIKRTKDLGMTALALTDHGNLFGSLEFYKECKKAGIKPIIGCEFYLAPGSRLEKKSSENENRYYHLILLAKNEAGWKNLMVLSSIGYTEGFYYKPRIDWEVLSSHCEGLICASACLGGEIPQLLLGGEYEKAKSRALEHRDLFGPDHYYLELQDHGIDEQRRVNPLLIQLSQETGIPLIVTNDSHYVMADHSEAQDILLCIGTGRKKDDPKRMSFYGPEFYLKSEEEMRALFSYVPEALENTVKIADMVDLNIKLPGPLLPDYPIPQEFLSKASLLLAGDLERLRPRFDDAKPEIRARLEAVDTQYLIWWANDGLRQRYKVLTQELLDRLDFELTIIIRMGFEGYFLIVADFIRWAKDHDIPVGPGRGSGAGSLVAYTMKITDLDPLRYKLLFERFLNPERISMPDFDVDFCMDRRGEVVDYVTEKYGKEKVGQIITFGTLKPKAVLKDVARVLDIPFLEANELSSKVPDDPSFKFHLDELLQDPLPEKYVEKGWTENGKQLREIYERGGRYKELFDTAMILEGLARHTSTHAAGVVIGKTKLTDYVPLYRDPKTEQITTQFTMGQLEECGLVKMDFLGLATLTLIKNTLKLLERRGVKLKEEDIPETDAKTFKMLSEGKAACVFQFESTGMQKILKQAKPTTIEDLIALNALYRPGPMDYIPQYIDCKSGKKPIEYPHPSLETILKETYGVIVYQEQVMQAAQIVAGYTLGGADILRRAMGKKKKEEMDKQRATFTEGAFKTHGLSEAKANEIFDILEKFAGYGFNKSHAAAYSVVAYKTAYLKANYPAEFMAANLTNEMSSHDKMVEYLDECKVLHIEVRPPHVNFSEQLFSVKDGKIIFGLMGMKNMGAAAAEEIIRAREKGGEFKDFMDFLERVDLRVVNKRVFETGIQCGLFDGLGPGRATLWHNLDRMIDRASKGKADKEVGQSGLFDGMEDEVLPPLEITPFPEWPQAELLAFEKATLGFYVSGHPLDFLREEWKRTVNVDLSKPVPTSRDEANSQLLGVVSAIRIIPTKSGSRIAIANLEDFRGTIELFLTTKVLEMYEHLLTEEAIIGVKGWVESRNDKINFKVNEIIAPDGLVTVRPLSVHVKLKNQIYTEAEVEKIRDFFLSNGGSSPLYLHLTDGKKEQVLRATGHMHVAGARETIEIYQNQSWAETAWRE